MAKPLLIEEIDGKAEAIRMSVLENDRGYLTTKQLESLDINTIYLNGFYKADGTCTNLPEVNQWGYLEVIHNYGDYVYQRFTVWNGNTYIRCKSNTWASWKQVATANSTLIAIPLNSGFTTGNNQCRAERAGNLVTLQFSVKNTNSTFAGDTHVATLPSGYITPRAIVGICGFGQNDWRIDGTGYFFLNTNGSIVVQNASSQFKVNNAKVAMLNVSYYVG